MMGWWWRWLTKSGRRAKGFHAALERRCILAGNTLSDMVVYQVPKVFDNESLFLFVSGSGICNATQLLLFLLLVCNYVKHSQINRRVVAATPLLLRPSFSLSPINSLCLRSPLMPVISFHCISFITRLMFPLQRRRSTEVNCLIIIWYSLFSEATWSSLYWMSDYDWWRWCCSTLLLSCAGDKEWMWSRSLLCFFGGVAEKAPWSGRKFAVSLETKSHKESHCA